MDLIKKFEHLKQVLVPLIITAAVVGVAIYLLVRFYRRPFSVGDPAELPIIGSRMAARWDTKDATANAEFPPTSSANSANDTMPAGQESRANEATAKRDSAAGNSVTPNAPDAAPERLN